MQDAHKQLKHPQLSSSATLEQSIQDVLQFVLQAPLTEDALNKPHQDLFKPLDRLSHRPPSSDVTQAPTIQDAHSQQLNDLSQQPEVQCVIQVTCSIQSLDHGLLACGVWKWHCKASQLIDANIFFRRVY